MIYELNLAPMLLIELKKKIEGFLKSENIEGNVEIDLFADPEYVDWRSIKLNVSINKDLDFVYDYAEPRVLELIRAYPKDVRSKILIKLESSAPN